MFKDEVWVNICGYENNYKISNYGRVYSVKNNSIINGYITKKGYHRVNLYKNGKSHSYAIHRLVALHFIPNPGQKNEVNHINGNKSNNKVENLEWVTNKENIDYTYKYSMSKAQKKVAKIDKNNNVILEIFVSLAEAGRQTNSKYQNISRCCKNKNYTHNGFKWIFATEDMKVGDVVSLN